MENVKFVREEVVFRIHQTRVAESSVMRPIVKPVTTGVAKALVKRERLVIMVLVAPVKRGKFLVAVAIILGVAINQTLVALHRGSVVKMNIAVPMGEVG